MKTFFRNLILVVVSAFISLLFGEVIIRITGLDPGTFIVTRDHLKKYSMHRLPNTGELFVGSRIGWPVEFQNVVKNNRFGFHDHNYPIEKPTLNTYRIIMLGDSYLEAKYVSVGKIFSNVMEKLLQDALDSEGIDVDVVNLGYSGWGQKDQYWALKHLGAHFNPDMIVVAYLSTNDMHNNYAPLELAIHEEARQANLTLDKPVRYEDYLFVSFSAINRCYAMYRAKKELTGRTRKRGARQAASLVAGRFNTTYTPVWKEAWAATQKYFNRINSIAQAYSAPLVVVCITTQGADQADQVSSGSQAVDYRKPEKLIAHFCQQKGIPYIDMGPELHAIELNKGTRWKTDRHWNETGNVEAGRLMAEKILPLIRCDLKGRSHPEAPRLSDATDTQRQFNTERRDAVNTLQLWRRQVPAEEHSVLLPLADRREPDGLLPGKTRFYAPNGILNVFTIGPAEGLAWDISDDVRTVTVDITARDSPSARYVKLVLTGPSARIWLQLPERKIQTTRRHADGLLKSALLGKGVKSIQIIDAKTMGKLMRINQKELESADAPPAAIRRARNMFTKRGGPAFENWRFQSGWSLSQASMPAAVFAETHIIPGDNHPQARSPFVRINPDRPYWAGFAAKVCGTIYDTAAMVMIKAKSTQTGAVRHIGHQRIYAPKFPAYFCFDREDLPLRKGEDSLALVFSVQAAHPDVRIRITDPGIWQH